MGSSFRNEKGNLLPDAETMSSVFDVKVQTVTPELAAYWLEHYNNRNRQKNSSGISFLAEEILAGRYVVTHQGIAFGQDGELYDGQHRLEAIVKADKPVTIMVTRGLACAARDVIDSGTGGGVRSPQDVMQMTDSIVISVAIRSWIANADSMIERGTMAGTAPRMTVHALRTGFERHKRSLTAIKAAMGERVSKISLSPVCAALVISHRVYGEKITEMASSMVKGEGLSIGNPALTIRNYLLQHSFPGPSARDEVAQRMFGAIDAYVRQVDLKLPRVNEGAREKIISQWKRLEESKAGSP